MDTNKKNFSHICELQKNVPHIHENYKIILHIEALSTNGAYFNDKRFGFKPDSLDWVAQVCNQVDGPENQTAVTNFKSAFDEGMHAVKLTVAFYTPNMFTKSGAISSKSGDLDNKLKTLIDVLFLPTWHGIDSHRKCLNLNIDDKYITQLMASKAFSESPLIIIELQILEK